MGRLSGFRYREIVRRLKLFGFTFDRQAAGSHEIWYNPITHRYITLPNHPGDMPEGTLHAILKQADLSVEHFLVSTLKTKATLHGDLRGFKNLVGLSTKLKVDTFFAMQIDC